MNKNDLVTDVISAVGEMSKADATKAVDAVFAGIMECLKKGEDLRLPNFGTFSVRQRAASEGRNPRTGEKITIAASKQVKFSAGKGFKDHVNGTAAGAGAAAAKKKK